MKVELRTGDETASIAAATMRLRVARRDELTSRVAQLELVPAEADEVLPQWSAGAHVTLHLPSGLLRQYSLCGDPRDGERYRIAVLREEHGRGGSIEAHRLREGDVLDVGEPRNSFPLVEADEHVLVAGGIGITPIAAMAWELHHRSVPFRVVLAVRSMDDAVLTRLLPQGCDVEIHTPANPLELAALLADVPSRAAVQVCGPTRMLDEAQSWSFALQRRGASVHVERFEASAATLAGIHVTGDQPFAVTFARSQDTVTVDPGSTILAEARKLGKLVDSSCEEGYCGTCETRVLAGVPDHRDDFLTPEEQAAGETMMICVSRCTGEDLVLDL